MGVAIGFSGGGGLYSRSWIEVIVIEWNGISSKCLHNNMAWK